MVRLKNKSIDFHRVESHKLIDLQKMTVSQMTPRRRGLTSSTSPSTASAPRRPAPSPPSRRIPP
jgi:hypothetical protein